MKKSLFWMMVLAVVFAFSVTTLQAKEDLGALAKKEKARREALEKQKKEKEKKVYTNDDIPKIKSQLGIIGSSDTGTDQTLTEPQPEQNQASNTMDYDRQIQQLQDQRDAAQAQADKDRELTGGGSKVMSSNYGDVLKSINDNEKKVEELNAKIQDLERQKEEAEAAAQKQMQQKPPVQEPPQQEQQQQEL